MLGHMKAYIEGGERGEAEVGETGAFCSAAHSFNVIRLQLNIR